MRPPGGGLGVGWPGTGDGEAVGVAPVSGISVAFGWGVAGVPSAGGGGGGVAAAAGRAKGPPEINTLRSMAAAKNAAQGHLVLTHEP